MPTTPTPPPARDQVIRTQEAEHKTIRELVEDLFDVATAGELAPVLSQLSEVLPEHFGHEEGPEGVFAGILEQDPMQGAMVGRFTAEHRTLARSLETAIGVLDADPVGALDLAHQLGRALAEHEREENELMLQALYEDMGAHD